MIESEKGKKISVRKIGKDTCKYHRENKNFDIKHLGPPDLCLDLYSAAYPYCLSLLYGAEFSWMKTDKDAVCAQCPAPNSVSFEVRRKKLEQKIISNGIKKESKIIIKITGKRTKGNYENACLCSHEVGQEFEFNQGDFLDYICPAAFYNMYPTIKLMLNEGKLPWLKNGKVNMSCPDDSKNIDFEILLEESKNYK